jgi:hypothetical protein
MYSVVAKSFACFSAVIIRYTVIFDHPVSIYQLFEVATIVFVLEIREVP